MSNIQFHRDASNRLTFERFEISADQYPQLCQRIAEQFQLTPEGELVIGLDVMSRDYLNGARRISLEWDIWSGFIVVAKRPNAESLVREIADWFETFDRQAKA